MDDWVDVEVPKEYGGALMVIEVGSQTLTIYRDDALALLEKMREKIGEMALPNSALCVQERADGEVKL
jgi:hypothetical protein